MRLWNLIVLVSLSPLLTAADLRVEARNGRAGEASAVQLSGDAGAGFQLFVRAEDPGLPLSSVYLPSITPLRVGPSNMMLAGVLDEKGRASLDFEATLGLDQKRLRFVARYTAGSQSLSNQARKTVLAANSFGEATATAQGASFQGDLFGLRDGSALAIGGAGPLVTIYDPVSEETRFAGLLSGLPLFQTRVQLADDRVLLVGGLDPQGAPLATAQLFDPATGLSTELPAMASARAGAAGARLANGKILIIGGLSVIDITDPATFFNGILNTTELFDPATNAFSAGPNIPERKVFATATLLNNGQVLVAGGLGVLPIVNIPFVSNTGYLYTTSSNSFGFFPKLFTEGRFLHNATKLNDGRVMLSGGITADLSGVLQTGDVSQIAFNTIASTAVYTTAGSGSFSNGPTLATSRALHTSSALSDGRALHAGGVSGALDIGSILKGVPILPAATDTSELTTTSLALPGPVLPGLRAGASAWTDPGNSRVVIYGGGASSVVLYQP
jgi:hypothetical protein